MGEIISHPFYEIHLPSKVLFERALASDHLEEHYTVAVGITSCGWFTSISIF
jgi:hypothetical protein